MRALDAARANVATAALERCLKIRQRRAFCARLTFGRSYRANRLLPYSKPVGAILLGVALFIAIAWLGRR